MSASSSGPCIGHLRGLALTGPGMTRHKAFFTDNWGLPLVAERPGALYFRGSGAEHHILALLDGEVRGLAYVEFGLGSNEQIDATHARLAAAGVTLLGKPAPLDTPGGGYGFDLIDPERRRVRISTGIQTHADTADGPAHPRKVSHVVLNSASLEASKDFYCDVLGFKVSDWSENQMVFLRCSTDHHSIALNRAPFASVNHVAFEMPSINAYMRGIGRMKNAGYPVNWGPGRHGPGDNPFAYFIMPHGFVFEYTAELQQIDEATHQVQVWPRTVPEKMDSWMTAGPPSAQMRAAMAGDPDAGYRG